MKSAVLVALLMLATVADQKIEIASLKFQMDAENWKLAFNNQNGNFNTYIYKRKAVTDADGNKVIPSFSFIIESVVPGSNVLTFSAQKRTQVPFEVTKVISHESGELSLKNAVGYFGKYKDRNGVEHKVYLVHAIYGDKGIQILGDITKSIESQIDGEMLAMLKSIEYYGED